MIKPRRAGTAGLFITVLQLLSLVVGIPSIAQPESSSRAQRVTVPADRSASFELPAYWSPAARPWA